MHAGKKSIPTEDGREAGRALSDEALTEREIDVLRASPAATATATSPSSSFISEETVKVHMKHIMEKLGASDRTQAVAIAMRRGIIQL